MAYFEIQNHHGEKIGSRVYFDVALARTVAKRTVGKWNKTNDKRGNSIKIVRFDGSIYPATIEWVA